MMVTVKAAERTDKALSSTSPVVMLETFRRPSDPPTTAPRTTKREPKIMAGL